MFIRALTGGIASRFDRNLIKASHFYYIENADFHTGSLVSFSKPSSLNIQTTEKFIYKFEDKWIETKSKASFVEYEDVLYYTQQGEKPKMTKAGKTVDIGLNKPIMSPAFTSTPKILDDYKLDIELTPSIIKGSDVLASNSNRIYKYRISIIENETLVKNHDIEITLPDSQKTFAVNIKIAQKPNVIINVYRLYDYFYKLVTSLTPNITIIYVDKELDLSEAKFAPLTSFYSATDKKVQYAVTGYNSVFGIESPPSVYTDELEVPIDNFVALTNINPLPNVDKKRIYRLGDSLVSMMMIAEIDNDITSYNDFIIDSEATRKLDTYKNYPPEPTMQHLVEYKSMLFGSNKNELVFTEIDKPTSWVPEYSFKFTFNITGLLPCLQGLLIFTDSTTHILTGNSIKNFNLTKVSEDQGCIEHHSAKNVKNTPLWVSHCGLCTLQGGKVTIVSLKLLGPVKLKPILASVLAERYFLLLEDKILLVDLRSDIKFSYLNINGVTDIVSYKGDKYFNISNEIHIHKHSDEKLQLVFKSAGFTEHNITTLKHYNKVDIAINGEFEIEIVINNKIVSTHQIKGDGVYNITPPAEKQMGNSIAINAKGYGTIYSIHSKTTPKG